MWRRKTVDELATTALADRWRQTCEGAGACRVVTNGAGVPVTVTPRVVGFDMAGVVRLRVRLLPGMLPADLTGVARRLAEGMGVAGVRVVPAGIGYVTVTLLLDDPLRVTTTTVPPVGSALGPVALGVGEDGIAVTVDLAGSAHLIWQGTTGSGKSVGSYGFLSQLAHASDVRVTGSDVSGLLLGPWAGRDDHGPVVLGTGDPEAHVRLFEDAAAGMDKRILGIPGGRDAVVLGPHLPILLMVVEEYPGLLRLLEAVDRKLAARARLALARLLAEGRKAGVRCLLIVQRAEAAVIGSYERGQASHRLSYRVDTAATIEMLHPGVPSDVAVEHATAPAGVALLTAPGQPLTRLRAPLCDYAEYCRRVAAPTERNL